MSYKRARVGGRIRDILSELLLREVADPRLHGLTITEVTLDQEMQVARVYVSGYDEDPKEAMLGLKSANSFLRREVARRVDLRKAPELIFIWDESIQRGERINALLESLDIPNDDGTRKPRPAVSAVPPAPVPPALAKAKARPADDDAWDDDDASDDAWDDDASDEAYDDDDLLGGLDDLNALFDDASAEDEDSSDEASGGAGRKPGRGR